MHNEKRLRNKVALVTGSAQGLGEACARLFAQHGATVLVSDINDTLGLKVAKELGPPSAYLHLDVSVESEWKNAMEIIEKEYGALDILVNNAGVTGYDGEYGPQDPENASLESWKHVHSVNLDSVFLGCKYAMPLLKKSKSASIINMASRSGIVGIPTAAAYASTKAAIRNHTKSVALYCAGNAYPIRCNAISPAAIMTPLWEPMLGTGEDRKRALERLTADIPLKRMGSPEDVAQAALYLASEESSYVTGTEIILDGGILAGSPAPPAKKK